VTVFNNFKPDPNLDPGYGKELSSQLPCTWTDTGSSTETICIVFGCITLVLSFTGIAAKRPERLSKFQEFERSAIIMESASDSIAEVAGKFSCQNQHAAIVITFGSWHSWPSTLSLPYSSKREHILPLRP